MPINRILNHLSLQDSALSRQYYLCSSSHIRIYVHRTNPDRSQQQKDNDLLGGLGNLLQGFFGLVSGAIEGVKKAASDPVGGSQTSTNTYYYAACCAGHDHSLKERARWTRKKQLIVR